MTYFFTADEHYNHKNIIKYCNRPFESIEEMNTTIVERHNEIVGYSDLVIHAGDFTLDKDWKIAQMFYKRLNGRHIFLKGSHDYWLNSRYGREYNPGEIWERTVNGVYIVICHYAMRVWARSHYNSWMLYGHSHGTLEPIGKQHDVGVDNNNFYPVSFEQLKTIMANRPDNPNLVKR